MADLSTASLHGVGTATYGGEASLDAQWWDTLTFSVGGNSPVDIPVTFSVDGTAAQGIGQFTDQDTTVSALAQIHPGAASCSSSAQLFAECVSGGPPGNGGSVLWQVSTEPSTTSNITVNQAGDSWGGGSITWDAVPSTQTATDFVENGTLVLDPGMQVINVGAALNIEALVGTLDFSNTASLSFNLPSGVTYTSASGVFDTSSTVPEPASLTLLATALAGFAAAGRRRRRLRLHRHQSQDAHGLPALP